LQQLEKPRLIIQKKNQENVGGKISRQGLAKSFIFSKGNLAVSRLVHALDPDAKTLGAQGGTEVEFYPGLA